jgi:hypothetical protein
MTPSVTFVRFEQDGRFYGSGTRVRFANGHQVTFMGRVPKGLALRMAVQQLDACGGACCALLGHGQSRPEVRQ